MKTIKLMAVAVLFAIGFAACEKSEKQVVKADITDKSIEVSTLKFDYEGNINILSGKSLDEQLLWNRNDALNVNVLNEAKIGLDFQSIPDIKIIEVGSDYVVYEMAKGIFNFKNIKIDENKTKMTLLGPNHRPVTFECFDPNSSTTNFLNELKPGQIISFQSRFPWPLVFGAAALVAAAVDAYCDAQIVKQVAACTAAKKCAIVHTCGADCVSCNLN